MLTAETVFIAECATRALRVRLNLPNRRYEPDARVMDQVQNILNGLKALCVLVIVGIVLYVLIASCGDSHTSSGSSSGPYSAPSSFTVSNEAVAQVVHDAIAGDSDATKMDGSPVVNCTGETTCTIAYTVQEPARALWGSKDDATDMQLIMPTRQMWKALFADPQFQSGTINVSGPATTIGGKSKTDVFYTLSCDRDAASQIDWNNVDGKGLRTLCNYQAQIQGLPGYIGLAPLG